MIYLNSDYIAGAHPEIIKKICETNLESLTGYGTDTYCESARDKIKLACECENAEVDFFMGGTQANLVIISTILNDHEGVIAADTGHISTHESGAIENGGHKVLALPHNDGKITCEALKSYLSDFYADANHAHMVYPGMVYISYPTEYGTLYTKKELEDISLVCQEYKIPLFLDGARLGYGLESKEADLTLPDIASICDIFYIGGTKVGALCGEAVVFTKSNRPKHFMTSMKKRGALLAKGRLLGVQFDTLFTDNLYFKISKHAIQMAENLKDIFQKRGYHFFINSPTNQQFIILENSQMGKLKEHVAFSFWQKFDEKHTVVRFATSWSTTQDDLNRLEEVLDFRIDTPPHK